MKWSRGHSNGYVMSMNSNRHTDWRSCVIHSNGNHRFAFLAASLTCSFWAVTCGGSSPRSKALSRGLPRNALASSPHNQAHLGFSFCTLLARCCKPDRNSICRAILYARARLGSKNKRNLCSAQGQLHYMSAWIPTKSMREWRSCAQGASGNRAE